MYRPTFLNRLEQGNKTYFDLVLNDDANILSQIRVRKKINKLNPTLQELRQIAIQEVQVRIDMLKQQQEEDVTRKQLQDRMLQTRIEEKIMDFLNGLKNDQNKDIIDRVNVTVNLV